MSAVQLNLLHKNRQPMVENFLEKSKFKIEKSGTSKIFLQKHLIEDVLEDSRKSICFHIETKAPNIYKEVGHLCFWLCKHKPYRLEPSMPLRIWCIFVKRLGQDSAKEIVEQRFKALQKMPVNEVIAIHLAKSLISQILLQSYRVNLDNGKIDDQTYEKLKKELLWKMHRLKGNKQVKLLSSLHSHNYSARAVAAMFELYFE